MSTAVACVPDGVAGGGTAIDAVLPPTRVYPVREVNRHMGLPTLAGCGHAFAPNDDGENGSTPVYWVNGQYRAKLASCDQSLVCDFCSRREQAASRERWFWHFDDWLNVHGGQLVHLRLGVGHGWSDEPGALIDVLSEALTEFRELKVFQKLGAVDYVRVLHPGSWSSRWRWNVHLHCTLFIRAGHKLDLDALLPELQDAWAARVEAVYARRFPEPVAGWGDRVWRAARSRTSRSGGLFARVFSDALDALYAWHWADDDEPDDTYHPNADLHPQSHLTEDRNPYEPDHGFGDDPDERFGMWDVGRAAAGDYRARAVWRELVHAVSGRHVVTCSDMLDRVWAEHLAEVEGVSESADFGAGGAVVPVPEFTVGNRLVSRAASSGAWDAALLHASAVRAEGGSGADALANFLSSALGCRVFVDFDADLTRVWADDIGPPPRRWCDPVVQYVASRRS